MTKLYDDGHVGVTFESERSTIRMLDHVPVSSRPPYIGVGQLVRLPHGVALLSGFAGAISRAHLLLILQALLDQGYKSAIVERLDGHAMPGSVRIESGDFSGLFRIDLVEINKRVNRVKNRSATAKHSNL